MHPAIINKIYMLVCFDGWSIPCSALFTFFDRLSVAFYCKMMLLQMIKNFHGQMETIKENAAIRIKEARR